MRCPECKTNVEADAAACPSCGLILLKLAAELQPHRRAEDQASQKRRATDQEPKRRAEDQAVQKRRAADGESVACEFCGGPISAKAIRCRHCSEIVNEDFYRARAHRLRARINYASWVAYLFGLAALLVFRPVGLLSIAGGLLLSIIYYAIPVEPPPAKGAPRTGGTMAFLKRQFHVERVAIPLPHFKSRKLVFVGTPLIAALVGYSANVILLQQPMDDVLKENNAFHGMSVSAHYKYWVIPGVVEYDLRQISVRQTPIDVHTAMLEFAKKVKAKRYSRVDLSYRGVTKFSIDGDSFQRAGEEYAKHNYDFVLYKLPRMFQPSGSEKSATTSDRDALLQFHRQWYGKDQLTAPVQNGMM